MFSRFKKTFQGIYLSCNTPLSILYLGSQDTLQPKPHQNKTFHDVRDLLEDFDIKSNLSSCQSEMQESQRKKKKARKARMRSIFKAAEEETTSMVSNDPWSCNRSISMVGTLNKLLSDLTNLL